MNISKILTTIAVLTELSLCSPALAAISQQPVAEVSIAILAKIEGRGKAEMASKIYLNDRLLVEPAGMVRLRLPDSTEIELFEGAHQLVQKTDPSNKEQNLYLVTQQKEPIQKGVDEAKSKIKAEGSVNNSDKPPEYRQDSNKDRDQDSHIPVKGTGFGPDEEKNHQEGVIGSRSDVDKGHQEGRTGTGSDGEVPTASTSTMIRIVKPGNINDFNNNFKNNYQQYSPTNSIIRNPFPTGGTIVFRLPITPPVTPPPPPPPSPPHHCCPPPCCTPE